MSNSATPWIVACQAALSMGFSRQEYWSRLPCPAPGDLPDLGSKMHLLWLLHCRQILYLLSHQESPYYRQSEGCKPGMCKMKHGTQEENTRICMHYLHYPITFLFLHIFIAYIICQYSSACMMLLLLSHVSHVQL